MEVHSNLVLLIGSVLLALSLGSDDVDGYSNLYYVWAENSSSCPHDPCATLTKYAENASVYFASDTQMVFLPGVHILKANASVHVENVYQLSLTSKENHRHENMAGQFPTIQCEGAAGFSFVNNAHLTIEHLIFSNCGQLVAFANATYAALAFHSIFYLTISDVTVQNSSGYGIYASNVLGIASFIIRSTFRFNSGSPAYNGGNIAVSYRDCSNHGAHLYIDKSEALYGYSSYPKANLVATGISLHLGCSNVKVNINHTKMIGNVASRKSAGGNLAILYFNRTNIIHNHVYVNNSLVINGRGNFGGGLFVYFYETPVNASNPGTTVQFPEALYISNTHFVGNNATLEGAGLYIALHEPVAFSHHPGLIAVSNCTFKNNAVTTHRDAGVAVHIVNHYSLGLIEHHQIQFSVLFLQCTFSNNVLMANKDPNSPNSGSGVVFVTQFPSNTSFYNCTFENNSATAIAAVNSYIVLSGAITIQNNTGIDGGGIVLCDRSYMFLTPYTNIIIANNHAQHSGGGIYAEHQCLQAEPLCFFEFVQVNRTSLETIHIELINNTAGYAGSALYGGSVDYCYIPNTVFQMTGMQLFNMIFTFQHSPGDLSYVSSDPLHVCFCYNGTPDCNIPSIEVFKFPGEMFQIAAVAVGQMQGTVPGVVVAKSSAPISDLQVSQQVRNTCTLLNYTVFSNSSFETLSLTVQRPYLNQGTQYETWLKVFLKTCPLGFSLTNERPYFCGCDPVLKRHGIVCHIDNQTIYRPIPNWIGYDHGGGGVLFHRVCPSDFCKKDSVYIKATNNSFNQDEQCAFNRTGILCGACPEGLSVVLGSSRCLTCSNFYLLLLIPFALAGFLLVIFLTVCNLTVSEGTLNGLILYANIVQANQAIFFPSNDTNTLAVFIAWLNLDLGIETCFYDGMDEYAKTWLQFAFPIYIWLISGAIILLSRRYNFASKLFGKNAVHVLATLFLLSFGKQVNTINAALSFTVITYPNESEVPVWLSDGNLQYWKAKHLVLFVAACVFLALALPYVVVLLLIQCLQRLNTRFLSWIRKLKPFFDAYTGPFKDKCRFWVGFLLIVRIFPFLVSSGTTLLVMALAWSFHGVYKKWPLNALEASFVLNLGVFAITTVNFQNNSRMQEISAGISVGIAFATFIGVLVYHTYMKFRNVQMCHNLFIRLQLVWARCTPTTQSIEATHTMESPVRSDQQLPPFVHFDEDREPLLAREDTEN